MIFLFRKYFTQYLFVQDSPHCASDDLQLFRGYAADLFERAFTPTSLAGSDFLTILDG